MAEVTHCEAADSTDTIIFVQCALWSLLLWKSSYGLFQRCCLRFYKLVAVPYFYLLVIPSVLFSKQSWFKTEVSMLIFQAVVWMWMWAAAKRMVFFFALRSLLHPHPPRSEPSVCPWWHAGTLAVWVWVSKGGIEEHERQDLHCPAPCPFLPSPPCSLLQFPRCPGYLCHGNCASLPAQTQIPPLVSLFASTMTQQLLQGFSLLPPQPRWYTVLIRQSSVLSSSSFADLNIKRTKIITHPTRLMCLVEVLFNRCNNYL